MMIAKNDEKKRSRIWGITVGVSSVLIVIVGVYVVTKLFTSNPLEGGWRSEDEKYNLYIQGEDSLTVKVTDVGEGAGEEVSVEMSYKMDKAAKTVIIQANKALLGDTAEKSEGAYTLSELESALGDITASFDYSVDRGELILTDREYGDKLTFVKE